ncbi:hypothetical protein Tco_0760699 [Tanacetum coccineum]
MLNKDIYVLWSSRLLRYAKSKPNGKLIYNSIMNGPYVRRMIPEPGDPDREVPVAETFHEKTDDKLTEKEVKKMEAGVQAIQITLMGLPEDIYAAVDSCETAQEIWLRVQQMMKGSVIGIQDKKPKLRANGNLVAARDKGTHNDKVPIYNLDGLAEVIQICLWCVDSGTPVSSENLKLFINFIWKLLGTASFRNDHIAAILGYEGEAKSSYGGEEQRNTIVVKNILKYLRRTKDMFLVYDGLDKEAITWRSSKQSTIALSSKEAEGIDVSDATHLDI